MECLHTNILRDLFLFFILHVYNIGLEDVPQLVPRAKLAQHPGPCRRYKHNAIDVQESETQ